MLMNSKRNRVYFEGGFGSQLLSALTYLHLAKDVQLTCDFSYFDSRNEIENPNLSFWNWRLGAYGFARESFPESNLFLNSRRRRFHELKASQAILSEIFESDYSKRFPISNDLVQFKVELNLSDAEEFACIHVRQGDYLKVASRVIPLYETLDSIKQVTAILPERVFIISDSELSVLDKKATETVLEKHNTVYIIGGDELSVHELMRTANVLVTSNSTFSFSAMLLAIKNQIAITPNNFHGDNNAVLNSNFILQKSWSINSKSARKSWELYGK